MNDGAKLLSKLNSILPLVGNSPLRHLDAGNIDLFVKIEYNNFSGSIKDRAAFNIFLQAIKNKQINEDTVVVESSSGNFAIAVASICSLLGLRFIAVVDPNINESYEETLKLMNIEVVKVTETDRSGNYLLTRIEKVKEICRREKKSFWTDQYGNPANNSGYDGLAREIAYELDNLDFIFAAVSTGGTITGLSRRLKELFPNIKVIGVDIEGSAIFGCKPQKRFISGIGASIASPQLKDAQIDEVIHVSHMDIIRGCHDLLGEHTLFGGASTGAVYFAIKDYFQNRLFVRRPNVAFLCADRGDAYLQTVYNPSWEKMLKIKIDSLKTGQATI
ncbi:MAG TPA: pyridoxal-phosphate dependent enzyme [Puia sp.]|nr:pyridoxal-phosphate dependent enzyme [Puia sp.]